MSVSSFHTKLKNHELIVGLSPMDGVTDCAYREICKIHGHADLLYTEFQNVHGMCLGAERIFEHFEYTENQHTILAQIYGQEVEYYYPAALLCFILGFDGVDINMGCPAKKISDRGAGAGLIRFPETAQKIIQEVKRARRDFQKLLEDPQQELLYFLKSQTPFEPEKNTWESLHIKWEKLLNICEELVKKWEVNSILNGKQITHPELLTVSVKTRIGYDTPILEKWILEILSQDIDFLCVHGRTLKQMYTGTANWEEIGKGIKIARSNGYNTPIFANGDIKSIEDAKKCLEITGADGLLVGRGTYGDPELLREIAMNFASQKPVSNTLTQNKINLILEHSALFEKFKGPSQFFQMRKVLGWYISGIDNAVELRKELYQSNSKSDVEKILLKYENTQSNLA